jgi:hypothetical protein
MRWKSKQKDDTSLIENWHSYFAWLPTRINTKGDIIWLETVERKGTFLGDYYDGYWDWEYRSIRRVNE